MEGLPKPIVDLGDHGDAIYNEVGNYLITQGIWDDVDHNLLLDLAIWWQLHMDAYSSLRDMGHYVTYSSGHMQVSPAYSVLKGSSEHLNRLYDQLGIGERARQKLKLGETITSDDPLDGVEI